MSKDKKIAACVIIYEPVKQVILAEHPTGRRWFKKGTKEPEKEVMSLPKGIIEDGEHPVEAAIREIKEETGLHLEKDRLHYLGKYDYIKDKDLEMFFYPVKENEIDIKSCICTSFFEDSKGRKLPEVNGFCWLNPFTEEKKYFFLAQQEVLNKIIKEYNEYFV